MAFERRVAVSGFSVPISQTQTNGFLGGVQGGYNWDFALGCLRRGSPVLLDRPQGDLAMRVGAGLFDRSRLDNDARRALGVTYDRSLLYVKGGIAWSKVKYSASLNLDGLINASTSVSDTRMGPMFGAGLEYAFLGNWSAKIEYNYIDFRSEDYNFLSSVGRRSLQPKLWHQHPRAGSPDQSGAQLPLRLG